MAQRGPLVTAVVVVGGLVGLMTANAAGGLVTAGGPAPTPSPAGATQTETSTTTEPPEETGTTTAPTLEPTSTSPTTEERQPPAAQFPAEVVYAGNAADVPLAIAVAVKGEDASAYLCDGDNVESWLTGTAADGTVDLKSKDGTTTLKGTLSGDTLAGSVSVVGVPHEFTIGVAPSPAGLYRGENGETTVGWIILQDGTQVGIARTGATEEPAPALDPARGGATVDGEFVPAEKVTGETRFG